MQKLFQAHILKDTSRYMKYIILCAVLKSVFVEGSVSEAGWRIDEAVWCWMTVFFSRFAHTGL